MHCVILWVDLSNHYHLLLETPEPNLVAGMKWFQGTYTQRFNAMFRCRGHLFQGRYKALPIDRALQALERAPDRDRQLLKGKMMQCTDSLAGYPSKGAV